MGVLDSPSCARAYFHNSARDAPAAASIVFGGCVAERHVVAVHVQARRGAETQRRRQEVCGASSCRKKKKSSTTTGVRGDVTTASKRTSESVSPAPASPSPGPAAAPRGATKAERKFEEVRMKRVRAAVVC